MLANPYHCFSHCQLASSGLGGASASKNTFITLKYSHVVHSMLCNAYIDTMSIILMKAS